MAGAMGPQGAALPGGSAQAWCSDTLPACVRGQERDRRRELPCPAPTTQWIVVGPALHISGGIQAQAFRGALGMLDGGGVESATVSFYNGFLLHSEPGSARRCFRDSNSNYYSRTLDLLATLLFGIIHK